eukprot:2669799-Pyramimonas_sp.AAC.2
MSTSVNPLPVYTLGYTFMCLLSLVCSLRLCGARRHTRASDEAKSALTNKAEARSHKGCGGGTGMVAARED